MRNLLEPEHLLVILLVVVLLFGGEGIPEMGAALGRGVRDFRRALDGASDDRPDDDPPTPRGDSTAAGPAPAPATRVDVPSGPKRLLPPES